MGLSCCVPCGRVCSRGIRVTSPSNRPAVSGRDPDGVLGDVQRLQSFFQADLAVFGEGLGQRQAVLFHDVAPAFPVFIAVVLNKVLLFSFFLTVLCECLFHVLLEGEHGEGSGVVSQPVGGLRDLHATDHVRVMCGVSFRQQDLCVTQTPSFFDQAFPGGCVEVEHAGPEEGVEGFVDGVGRGGACFGVAHSDSVGAHDGDRVEPPFLCHGFFVVHEGLNEAEGFGEVLWGVQPFQEVFEGLVWLWCFHRVGVMFFDRPAREGGVEVVFTPLP